MVKLEEIWIGLGWDTMASNASHIYITRDARLGCFDLNIIVRAFDHCCHSSNISGREGAFPILVDQSHRLPRYRLSKHNEWPR
jgi:hypothetical protein